MSTTIISSMSTRRKGGGREACIAMWAWAAAFACLASGPGSMAAEPAAAVAAQEDIETGVRVGQFLKDAQRKREAGQIAEALADLRAANALIKKAKGAGHPDALPVLDMAGSLLLENGQIAEAQTPLGKAVAMREELIADGRKVPPAELAAALVMLARAEMMTGKHEEARDGLTKAVGLFESSVGAGHESTLAALEQLANVHFALGETLAGEEALQQVLNRRRRLGAAAKGGMLSTATALARARAWSGRAAAAIGPLTTAIADHERGRFDKKLVPPALRQLADLHAETGDVDAARKPLERALDLDRSAFGEGHAAAIIDRLSLLRLEPPAGGAEAVGAACDPLVARLQQLAGEGHPQAAAGLRAAAEVWLATHEFGRASELYRQALELDKRLLGEDHADVAADDAGLGRCLLGNGDAAAALPLLEHALALSKRTCGPRHADTLAITAAAGDCAARAGDRARAEKHLQSLIDAEVPRRSDADESLLCGLVDGLAALEERAGDRDRAMETRISLITLRRQQFGEQHERVADVMVRLANSRQAAGGHADAVALYERAIAVMEAFHDANHPEVAAILAPLAVSYRALGANEQAERALARGLAIWEATVGPDHPVTIATIKPLALVRLALKKDEEALPLMERLLVAYDADPATPPADRVKLLKKLAQIHEARGDEEIARRYLERVVEIEAALGKTAAAAVGEAVGEPAAAAVAAVDTSKLKRMLTVDEEAEANLAKARSIAASLQSAQERLSKADSRNAAKPGGAATAREPVVAERKTAEKPPVVATAQKPSGQPGTAAIIASAWERYRSGQRGEAVTMLQDAIAAIEKAGAGGKSPQQADLAELLVTVADMRPQILDWPESIKLYDRAFTVATASLGTGHPTTVTTTLRLSTAQRARGAVAVAKAIDDKVAAKVEAAAQQASREQLESLREALRGAVTVALAADDRPAVIRSLDMLLDTGSNLDDRSLLLALDAFAGLAPIAAGDEAASKARSRCLQVAKQVGGSRPVLSGIVQHHLGLVEVDAGKLPAGATLLQQAADIDRQTLGQAHPRVAYHILALATIRSRQGDRDAAGALLDEARKIESRSDRATAAMVADLCRLAAAHTDRREFEEAAKLLTAAWAAQEKAAGGGALAVAEIAEQSARLSIARGQFQRARDLLAESAAIVQANHGSGHAAAVAAMLRRERANQRQVASADAGNAGSNPAAQAEATGKGMTFAERLAQKEAEVVTASRVPRPDEGAAPAESPSIADPEKARRALDAVARPYAGDARRWIKSATGREGLVAIVTQAPRPTPFVAASESGLRQRVAVAKLRATGVAEGSSTVDQLMLAARSAQESGSRNEAIASCEDALALAVREAGEQSLPVADVLDQFATITIAQGNLPRAKQLLERLGSMRWKLLGPADPQVADAAVRLARLLADCGEYERARPLANRALVARMKAADTQPTAAAESLLLMGKIDLGRGDQSAAESFSEQARKLLPATPRADGQQAAADGDLLTARLALVRLLIDLGDLQAAAAEADQLVSDLGGGRPAERALVEAILFEAARAHRLAGDATGAVAIASRLVGIAQTSSSAAVFLAELALAQRAAGDPSWEASATEAGRVLVPYVRRLSPEAADAAATNGVVELAVVWRDAGQVDRAEEAFAAASLGAGALPPTHPVAVRVKGMATR